MCKANKRSTIPSVQCKFHSHLKLCGVLLSFFGVSFFLSYCTLSVKLIRITWMIISWESKQKCIRDWKFYIFFYSFRSLSFITLILHCDFSKRCVNGMMNNCITSIKHISYYISWYLGYKNQNFTFNLLNIPFYEWRLFNVNQLYLEPCLFQEVHSEKNSNNRKFGTNSLGLWKLYFILIKLMKRKKIKK